MPIDASKAMAFLERISFPRLGGSEGEKKAAAMIADELRGMGLQGVHRERWEAVGGRAGQEVGDEVLSLQSAGEIMYELTASV